MRLEVPRLIVISRSGSLVLTSRRPLSLSWPVYQDVSSALTESLTKNIDVKVTLDLEYLSTFLARLPRLSLYHSRLSQPDRTEFYGLIHLSGLGQLRELSLTKIPVHLIQDLVLLRAELETLSLQRCCFTLESLVSLC